MGLCHREAHSDTTHTYGGCSKCQLGARRIDQPPHEGTGSKGLELNSIGKKWLNHAWRFWCPGPSPHSHGMLLIGLALHFEALVLTQLSVYLFGNGGYGQSAQSMHTLRGAPFAFIQFCLQRGLQIGGLCKTLLCAA